MSYRRPYSEITSQDNASQRQWEPESLNLSYKTREALSKAIDEVSHHKTYQQVRNLFIT